MTIFNKTNLFWQIIVAVMLLAIVFLSVRLLSGPEDAWLCQNGKWIKHGQPSASKPVAACLPTGQAGGQPTNSQATTTTQAAEIEVFSPKANELISSPLIISGRAKGTWFFEASFPVELWDSAGKIIAQVPAQAQGEWMTTEFVPFEARLTFPSAQCLGQTYPCSVPARLILKKDNPSDMRRFDAQIEIPVKILEQSASAKPCQPVGCSGQICSDEEMVTDCLYLPEYECFKEAECQRQLDGQCGWTKTPALAQCLKPFRTEIKVFFNNNNLDKEITCVKVFSVNRQVAKTAAVARAALEELLKGPTISEKESGYFTNINPGVAIQKLTIENGAAKVDFNETMEQGMGGSCRVSAIRAQITETLKQFSTVKNVIISINGRTEDILQP